MSAEERAELWQLVDRFRRGWETGVGCTSLVDHEIETGTARPIKERCYPVSPYIQRIMDEELDVDKGDCGSVEKRMVVAGSPSQEIRWEPQVLRGLPEAERGDEARRLPPPLHLKYPGSPQECQVLVDAGHKDSILAGPDVPGK